MFIQSILIIALGEPNAEFVKNVQKSLYEAMLNLRMDLQNFRFEIAK